MNDIKQISVFELKDKMDSEDSFILLDVRESNEVNICALNGAIHMPMITIPNSLSELDRDKEIVVMCHTGMRSFQVCQYLVENGYNAVNLQGGIDQWSREIDPTIARY